MEGGVEDVEVSVDGEEGGDDDVLRQIYDLLAAHFEGGEEEAGMDDMEDFEDLGDEEAGEEEAGEDAEEDDADEDEEDLEEAASIGYGDKGGSKKAWYKEGKKKKSKKGALQERFQKLANII